MKTLLHILKKDLRRYAWAWGVLAVCAVARVYLDGTTAGMLDNDFNQFLSFVTSIIGSILGFVLVVMVVQEESLSDPDAYWITRPVNRLHLLFSKLVFLVLVVILPQVLADSLVLVLNDGSGRVGFALAGIFPALAIWQSQVFLAAQTRSLPRYLLLVVCLVVGFYIVLFALAFLGTSILGDIYDIDMGVLPADTPSWVTELVQTVLWLAGGFGILAFYYLRRKRLLAWLCLLPLVLASAILTTGGSSSGFLPGFDMNFESDVEIISVRESGTRFTPEGEFVTYEAEIQVPQVESGQDVWVQVNYMELASAGASFHIEGNYRSQLLNSASLRGDTYQLRLGSLKKADAEKLGDAINISGGLEISLSSQQPLATLPLKEGASLTVNGKRLVIGSYYRDEGNLVLELAAIIPNSSFEAEQLSDPAEAFLGQFSFALKDKQSGQLQIGELGGGYDFGMSANKITGQAQFKLAPDESVDAYELQVFTRVVDGRDWVFVDADKVPLQKQTR